MKKIVVIGPESTGKSSLCELLAKHYNTVWCPEYAREYLTAHGAAYSFDDLLTIAKGQVALEGHFASMAERQGVHSPLPIVHGEETSSGNRESAIVNRQEVHSPLSIVHGEETAIANRQGVHGEETPIANRQSAKANCVVDLGEEEKSISASIHDSRSAVDDSRLTIDDSRLTIADSRLPIHDSRPAIFIDTDLYVMKVWCEFVFNTCHTWILEQIASRKYDLYLFCNIDLPWEDDPLREYPDEKPRQELYRIYKDILVNQPTPWVEISGSYNERFKTAVAAVDKLLHE